MKTFLYLLHILTFPLQEFLCPLNFILQCLIMPYFSSRISLIIPSGSDTPKLYPLNTQPGEVVLLPFNDVCVHFVKQTKLLMSVYASKVIGPKKCRINNDDDDKNNCFFHTIVLRAFYVAYVNPYNNLWKAGIIILFFLLREDPTLIRAEAACEPRFTFS